MGRLAPGADISAPSHAPPAPPEDFVERFRRSLPDEYLALHSERDLLGHARAAWGRRGAAASIVVSDHGSALTVCAVAESHRDALAHLCAAMMAAGLTVLSAVAHRRADGDQSELVATFEAMPSSAEPALSTAELEAAVRGVVEALVAGRTTVADILRSHAETLRPGRFVPTEVEVEVDRDGTCWLQVVSLDRPGILAAITGALASLDITSTHSEVTTVAGLAVDRFNLVDETGGPLSRARRDAIRTLVQLALEEVHRAYC